MLKKNQGLLSLSVLVIQAVMNIGCMGGACVVPQNKQQIKQVNKHEESL